MSVEKGEGVGFHTVEIYADHLSTDVTVVISRLIGCLTIHTIEINVAC